MPHNPVITTVTDIAHRPEEVWRVLTDFAGWEQWHPALRFVDVPTEVLPGTRLRVKVSGTGIDGEYDFTVLEYEAPRRLVWEGGVPGVVMGQHSFVLDPYDGGTRYTESEEFTGPAAVETVEPARSTMEAASVGYGQALKDRLESRH
jgi:uncharacterized protein YndB with AHSA1/START domain